MPSDLLLPLLSPSMRTSWRTCPRKVFFRYMAGIEMVSFRKALAIGTAFHRGLEVWRQGGGGKVMAAARRQAAKVASDHYLELALGAGVTDLQSPGQVAAYVAGYLDVYGVIDQGVELVEQQVFDDDGGDGETGFADALIRYPDGRLWVVDDKTTTKWEDERLTALSFRMDDQLATYVAALRARGVNVAGARLRQTKKTQTRINKNESPDDYAERVMGIYTDATGAQNYREFVIEYTDSELAASAKQKERDNLEILSHLDVTAIDKWPFNPASCRGAYGPCDYVTLCAIGRDCSSRLYKPNGKEPLDGGRYQSQIWQDITGNNGSGRNGGGSGGGPSAPRGNPLPVL